MHEVLLDALIDTGILTAYIFIACLIIEFIEQNAMASVKVSKLLGGKMAPLISAGVGIVPQCGFSAIATKLYTKRHIQIGTLIAVYISTSDEAIPILLAYPDKIGALLPVIGIKFLFAIIVGFSLNAIFFSKEKQRKNQNALMLTNNNSSVKNIEKNENENANLSIIYIEKNENDDANSNEIIANDKTNLVDKNNIKDEHTFGNDVIEEQIVPCEDKNCKIHTHDIGCCHHHMGCESHNNKKVVTYFVHPLIHTLKIAVFIFVVNALFGTGLHYLGEEKLMSFMMTNNIFQPFLSALVGIVPNCAASVVVTKLYVMGGLSLGSLIAGLSVNAGIAFVILFKENKNVLENISIVGGLYLLSSLLGVVVFAIERAIALA